MSLTANCARWSSNSSCKSRPLRPTSGLPMPSGPLPYYKLPNLHGLDIERIAVSIARITLWMGHRQTVETYKDEPSMRAEDPLPLVDLSGIQAADALRVPWPEVEAIIGNPPFLGSQHLRGALGDEYVEWLKREFCVGIKDFCVYWFRKANDALEPGQRAGLVGTNSISQNRARSASLQYIVEHGGVITDAISSQVWPGDAKVHVSIVNWIKEPFVPGETFLLDGRRVVAIDDSLHSAQQDRWRPRDLKANAGRCFQGLMPVGYGFVISESEYQAFSGRDAEVVRPFLTGEDIANGLDQSASRCVIDFGERSLEDASKSPAAIAVVRQRVKPDREKNRDARRREYWWRFGRPFTAVRSAMATRPRVIAMNQVGKRPFFVWIANEVCPNSKINVFAFDDDYAMGVLTSRTHIAWAWAEAATLKADLSYTPTSVFATFPWPDPISDAQREAVAEASRQLLARRSEVCQAEQIGLTTLYNRMDDGAFADLRSLHLKLDQAVAACYGWPSSVAQDNPELVRRLTELNKAISTGECPYSPFDH